MKILITGPCGIVGPGVVKVLGERHELRLLDLVKSEKIADCEWVIGSILDPQVLSEAMKGIEAVVHMARVAKVRGRDPTTQEFFDVNVKGHYLVMEAAAAAGVKRFVHISSTAPVIGHWYEGRDITVDSPFTTTGRYSLTKGLQEVTCEHFSRNSDMRIVALRFWGAREGAEARRRAAAGEDAYDPGMIDTEDLGRAALAAIENDKLGKFVIFHCVATQEARRRFDSQRTERLLGWKAQDDFSELRPKP